MFPEWLSSFIAYVRDNPLVSIVLAGIGAVLFGFLYHTGERISDEFWDHFDEP